MIQEKFQIAWAVVDWKLIQILPRRDYRIRKQTMRIEFEWFQMSDKLHNKARCDWNTKKLNWQSFDCWWSCKTNRIKKWNSVLKLTCKHNRSFRNVKSIRILKFYADSTAWKRVSSNGEETRNSSRFKSETRTSWMRRIMTSQTWFHIPQRLSWHRTVMTELSLHDVIS